ncbi:MAG: LPS-assembly protein LptD [Nitrospinales bacterium]
MKVLLNSIMSIFLLLFLSGEVLAVSPSKSKSSKPKSEPPIKVTADHVDQRGDNNIIRAWGNVVIRHEGKVIKADKVMVNSKSGKGKAEGHVIILSKDGTKLKSKKTTFDLKSKKGKMVQAKGQVGKEFLLQAKEIRKLGNKHYQADEGLFTTCRGEVPDWLLQVNSLDLKIGDRALFQGAIFRIKNIPVFYFPLGYLPLDNTRKSGFLMPIIGNSSINGYSIEESYFWAINQWSDATFSAEYMDKRGVQLSAEYRYTPNKNTSGRINAVYLDDKITNEPFWKINGNHRQKFDNGAHLVGQLDVNSDNNFAKTFVNNTEIRTRRSTDSYVAADKAWENNSLDIMTRHRVSIEDERDETFALLPQLTSKTHLFQLANTPVYFTQESSYTGFLTDSDDSLLNDDLRLNQRVDVHPQLAMPLQVSNWLTVTPKVGVRGTYYSEKLQGNVILNNDITRELVDVNVIAEGPKIQKTYSYNGEKPSLFKHIIEPRVQYDYIPDMDSKDIAKIRVIDNIDSLGHMNQIKYSIIQRLFMKTEKDGISSTKQKVRFEISQSYDIVEADRTPTATTPSRPFSNLRFDLDSRITDNLLLNVDTEFNVYDTLFETFNFQVGIKPFEWVSLFIGRRYTTGESSFFLGSLSLQLPKGWNLQFSTRYDDRLDNFQENDVGLQFANKCKCWGFAVDYINRNNINGGIREEENKLLFSLELQGIGRLLDGRSGQSFIHRTF